MCGIAGIWRIDGPPVERTAIERFIGALAHRGPDGQDVLLADAGRLALAHRRLAIFDLTDAGRQPMRSASGRFDITYNGEVYNFLELRADLERSGIRFHSNSDTEVVLAAFERWGPECLLRFNGMWSIAIWDRQRRTLFLARDRFGVKPLYVGADARQLAFASELKAFLHLEGFDPAPDIEVLRARLAGDFSEGVLLRGIDALPAGYCMEVSVQGARRWRWWNTLDHLVSRPGDIGQQGEAFRELLFDACRLRLRGDVPMATSLSGGLDSSAVLCSLAAIGKRGRTERESPEWRRAFVACFPGTLPDETAFATLAARAANTVPSLRPFSGDDVVAGLDDYLYHFEEIGGLAGIASWALYREMRRDGVVISLDGHGGDELLGGYGLHVMLALLRGDGLIGAPARTLDLIATLQRMHAPGQPETPGSKAVLAALTIPGVRAVLRRMPVLGRGQRALEMLLQRHSFDPGASSDPAQRMEEQAIDALGPLSSVLYRSFHRLSLPRILRNFDVYSMAHGVEVRMPLLDWRLVCYAFSLRDESKVSGGYTKLLLREAMRGVLPDRVRLRPEKLGYNAPVANWLGDGLGQWLWNEVNDQEFQRSELWDGPELLQLAAAKRKSHSPWSPAEARRITLALTAHRWLTRWLGTASQEQRTPQPLTG